jgi:preprotein translocase subunit SecA
MLKLISKLIGGNKSEKDVKQIEPLVIKINEYFQQYQSLSHDELRAKTAEFKQRIKDF